MTYIASTVTSMGWLQMVGMIILLIGVIGTMFSSYRYLLVYMLAGMGYWFGIEAISFSLQQVGFTEVNGYISAVGLSMVAIFIWVVVTEPQRQQKRAELRAATYIEHTPFEGEVPTSKG